MRATAGRTKRWQSIDGLRPSSARESLQREIPRHEAGRVRSKVLLSKGDVACGASQFELTKPQHIVALIVELGLLEPDLVPRLPDRLQSAHDLLVAAIGRAFHRRGTSLDGLRRSSGVQGPSLAAL